MTACLLFLQPLSALLIQDVGVRYFLLGRRVCVCSHLVQDSRAIWSFVSFLGGHSVQFSAWCQLADLLLGPTAAVPLGWCGGVCFDSSSGHPNAIQGILTSVPLWYHHEEPAVDLGLPWALHAGASHSFVLLCCSTLFLTPFLTLKPVEAMHAMEAFSALYQMVYVVSQIPPRPHVLLPLRPCRFFWPTCGQSI